MFCRPGLRLSPLLWFTKRFFKVCRGLQNFSVVVFTKSGNICQTVHVKIRFNTISCIFVLFYLMFHFVLIAVRCSKHSYFCSVIILCLLKFSHIDSFYFSRLSSFLFIFIILLRGVVILKFSIFYNSQYFELIFCGLITISVMYTACQLRFCCQTPDVRSAERGNCYMECC